jgi:hypothetical protein
LFESQDDRRGGSIGMKIQGLFRKWPRSLDVKITDLRSALLPLEPSLVGSIEALRALDSPSHISALSLPASLTSYITSYNAL